jgi:hypothetical protein
MTGEQAQAGDPADSVDYLEWLRLRLYHEMSRAIGWSGWPCWYAELFPSVTRPRS